MGMGEGRGKDHVWAWVVFLLLTFLFASLLSLFQWRKRLVMIEKERRGVRKEWWKVEKKAGPRKRKVEAERGGEKECRKEDRGKSERS